MNYLLYQPALLSEPDCVYKNSTLVEQEPIRTEIYNCILQLTKNVSGKQSPVIKKSNHNFVLKGQFDAQDEKGRTLAFLFVTDSDNVEEELNAICVQIGYSIAPSTTDAIRSFFSQKKRLRFLICLLSTVGICLLIYSFIKFLFI